MQTFLPYRDFISSAMVLDRQRLGKQRVETMQIMKALTVPGAGWANHPVTKMWRGYEGSLIRYQEAICHEWVSRGYKDTCLAKTWALYDEFTKSDTDYANSHRFTAPPWWGLKRFHSAHRANLLRKDSAYYGQFAWREEPSDIYWYPRLDSSGCLVG
jgi:hypothetical protein